MESLVYISRSAIEAEQAEHEVANIVTWSRRSNPKVGLTGGLVFTGRHFAQILEGETDVLDAMMSRLMADTRHSDVMVLDRRAIDRRYFFDWSLAYGGAPNWVDKHIEGVFSDGLSVDERSEAKATVAQIILQFALIRRCAA